MPTRECSSVNLRYESGRHKDYKREYFRKVIFSGGMIHLILGLAYCILWTVGSSLVFNLEVVSGGCFVLSGIVGIFSGKFNNRYLDFTFMVTSILSALSCLALCVVVIYVYSLDEKRSLTNPLGGVFMIYTVMGFAFALITIFYAYIALRASKIKTSTFRRRSSATTSDSPATKMTATTDVMAIENQQWIAPRAGSFVAKTKKRDSTQC